MTKEDFKNIVIKTFKLGQRIIFKGYNFSLFKEFQENIAIIKYAFKELNFSENLEKVLYEVDVFSESKYTIDDSEKIFYFFAAFRTHGLKFLTKNTYEHKVKRYIFDVNFKLDYIQNIIEE